MEKISTEPVQNAAEEYVKTTFELFKLKLLNTVINVTGSLVIQVLFLLFLLLFLVIANIGVAFWLGEVTGKVYYGFFLVGGFYLLLGLVVMFFMHKTVRRIVGNIVLKEALD